MPTLHSHLYDFAFQLRDAREGVRARVAAEEAPGQDRRAQGKELWRGGRRVNGKRDTRSSEKEVLFHAER